MEVIVSTSPASYGLPLSSTIYKSDGSKSLVGFDFGDLETGVESSPHFLYYRHDGLEPIYSCGVFIRPVGINWGGYVETASTSYFPHNPNFFKNGGLRTDNNLPQASTADYEFMRTSAYNNPEMGVRLHMDRTNPLVKTDGLGYQNKGISSSPVTMSKTALDWSKSGLTQVDGKIYPSPEDSSKIGKAADEAVIGVSVQLSEDVIGSGNVQFSVAFKYRYTQ